MAKVPGAAQIGRGPSLRDPGVTAPAAAFDLGGEGLQQAAGALETRANRLGEIAERRRQTQQTVDRVERSSRARGMAFQAYTDWQKASDIREEGSAEAFVKGLDETLAEIRAGHTGDEESFRRLEADFNNLKIDYLYKAATESTLARREYIVNAHNGQVSEQSGRLFQTPETLPDELSVNDANIEALSGGLGTRVVEELKARSQATLIRSALDGAIVRGDFDTTYEIMSDTNPYMQALPPDEQRQYRARAATAKSETDNRTAFQKDVQWLADKGVTFTPGELKRMKGLEPAERNQVIQDIEAFEKKVGRPATEVEVQQFFDVEAPAGAAPFGRGVRGNAMRILAEEADRFASGVTTVSEDREFLLAATEFLRPYVDPVSQTLVPASIPPYLPATLARRGYRIDEAGSGIVRIEGAAVQDDTRVTDGTPTGTTPLSQESAIVDTLTTLADDGTPPDRAIPPDADLFGNAADTTGLSAGIGRALARTPIIGDALIKAPKMTQAGATATLIRDRVARALQQTERFVGMELKDVKADLGSWTTAWTSPDAFRNDLVALDTQLWRMHDDYMARGDNQELPAKERQRVRIVLEEIEAARTALGVRQRRVSSRAEAMALPAGTVLITSDGVIMTRLGDNAPPPAPERPPAPPLRLGN